ncbi:hypothetical protein BOX15_Mlig024207g1 [Macrostomum lignano]|uniref:ANK_REP_REGION domain-containing protein n=2 Tax=Macrostomum lignano TaxID=282301 RepID=A0A1I8JB50_9PLAT|nr:hypothetical protein BOX15_Mlig024207g1 [Macrostomum lignano]
MSVSQSLANLEQAVQLLHNGQLELCTKLVEQAKTAQPELLTSSRDSSGRGLLHWACVKGAERIVELALTAGSPETVDSTDDQDWTPLMLAASAGHLAVARRLLGAGANPDASNATGQRALHYAASKNRPELARLLLDAGADAGPRDATSGVTPLHRSCAQGHTAVTSLLLSRGAPVNVSDSVGNTPLHFACEEGRLEDARLLIEAGANVGHINKEEKTAFDLAPSPADKRQLELFAQNVNQ